jgi:endonuclease/exonuclease/phosphatase family metal-dependent hydrolase
MKVLVSALILAASFGVQALTIGAYNIRNFDYDQRYRISTNKSELSLMLRNMNVDVLSIEEISNTKNWESFVKTKLPGYDTEVSRCGGEHGQHLGFLFNTKTVELLSFNEDLAISIPGTPGSCDSGSRPLAIGLFRIKATGQRFYGMTAHLKSGSNPASIKVRAGQFEVLKKIVNELKNKTGIRDFYFAGDLNTTEYNNRGADYTLLTKVVKDLGMIDITENLKCTAYWWGGTDDGIESPTMLDHVVVTPGLIKTKSKPLAQALGHCQKVSCRQVPIKELGISYESVSDHCPVTAVIQ